MTKQHPCHLPNSTALLCIGVVGFGLAETPLRLCSTIVVVSDRLELGRWR